MICGPDRRIAGGDISSKKNGEPPEEILNFLGDGSAAAERVALGQEDEFDLPLGSCTVERDRQLRKKRTSTPKVCRVSRL